MGSKCSQVFKLLENTKFIGVGHVILKIRYLIWTTLSPIRTTFLYVHRLDPELVVLHLLQNIFVGE